MKAPDHAQQCFAALRRCWPEYLLEATELGLFMISACAVVVVQMTDCC